MISRRFLGVALIVAVAATVSAVIVTRALQSRHVNPGGPADPLVIRVPPEGPANAFLMETDIAGYFHAHQDDIGALLTPWLYHNAADRNLVLTKADELLAISRNETFPPRVRLTVAQLLFSGLAEQGDKADPSLHRAALASMYNVVRSYNYRSGLQILHIHLVTSENGGLAESLSLLNQDGFAIDADEYSFWTSLERAHGRKQDE